MVTVTIILVVKIYIGGKKDVRETYKKMF